LQHIFDKCQSGTNCHEFHNISFQCNNIYHNCTHWSSGSMQLS
jgi:hypothetical protein